MAAARVQLAADYIQRAVLGKPRSGPQLVIKFGPPGSGKSLSGAVMHAVFQEVIREDPRYFVDVDVDDMIQKLTPYEEDLRRLLLRETGSESGSGAPLSPETERKVLDLYFGHRREADFYADALLSQAILDRHHIAVETTGSKIEWWRSLIERARLSGYRVILVYPYVPLPSLRLRLEERNRRQTRRVPMDMIVAEQVHAIQRNFLELAPIVNQALVLDNRTDLREGKSDAGRKREEGEEGEEEALGRWLEPRRRTLVTKTLINVVNGEPSCKVVAEAASLADETMVGELREHILRTCERCRGSAACRPPASRPGQ